jgi:hypothetical protein
VIAFRDVTNPTNERTFICTFVPKYAYNHKLPILLPEKNYEADYIFNAPLILSNLSSFVFDYVARKRYNRLI